MHKEILEDIGEKELINRLGKFMPKNQISDDCALIKTKNENLLVNTDSLVENVHFNDITICPMDLGWKAVVSNISDLLSSGSKKTIGITISLVLPARTEWIWVEELYKGINKALKEYGGMILGGDCSKGCEKIISITAFGIQGELELRRNACMPGDIILTTGIHGLSKLGFLIQNKINFDNEFSLNERLIIKSIEHFCRPRVYPNFLNNLLKTRSNKNIRRIGCTDSSDGLFQALQDLAIASNCKAIINYEKIPKDKDWPKGDKWDEYYFFGGEDYELVFSLPKKWAKNLSKFNKDIKSIKPINIFYKTIEGLEEINIVVGNPIRPMLAERLSSSQEIIDKVGVKSLGVSGLYRRVIVKREKPNATKKPRKAPSAIFSSTAPMTMIKTPTITSVVFIIVVRLSISPNKKYPKTPDNKGAVANINIGTATLVMVRAYIQPIDESARHNAPSKLKRLIRFIFLKTLRLSR